jgi:hypothetical protein
MTIEKFGANAKTAAALPSIKREQKLLSIYWLTNGSLPLVNFNTDTIQLSISKIALIFLLLDCLSLNINDNTAYL